MKYFTADNPPPFKGSNPGSGKEKVYVKRLQKDGSTKLVLKGESNTYAKIQASLDDVDIFKQIQRYGLDVHSSLKDLKARFLIEDGTETIDVSFNGSFNDFHNNLKDAENAFNSFSPDVRSFYGNDLNRFKASLLNKTIDEDLAKMHKMFNIPQPVQPQTAAAVQPVNQQTQQVSSVKQPVQQNTAVNTAQNTSVIQPQVNNGVIAGQQSMEVINNG